MFFVQHFFHCRFFGKYFFCKPIYSTAGDNLRKLFKTKYKPLKAPVFAPCFEGVPKCNICSQFVNNILGVKHKFFIHFYNISNRKNFECSFQQFKKPPQNRHFYKVSTEFSTIATAFSLVFNQVFNTFAFESGI